MSGRILIPGVSMSDVQSVRESKTLPADVISDAPVNTNRECQGVKALAKKQYRKYDEIYQEVLSLVPDVTKAEHPDISDFEWVCYNFMLSEDETLLSPEELEIAKKVKNKKSDTKPNNVTKALPADVISGPSRPSTKSSAIDNKARNDLKDFVSKKLDSVRDELFKYIDNL